MRHFLLAGFLMLSVLGSAQVAGDYRSVASGTWTTLASWQRYNGTTWATPTAGEGYPGQFTGTGTVTIMNGSTIGVAATVPQSFTALVMGDGVTTGILSVNASVSIFTPRITVKSTGTITFTGNFDLQFPANSVFIVESGGILNTGALACNSQKTIRIGTTVLGTCNGNSTAYSFAELMANGGFVAVSPTYNPVCIGGSLQLFANRTGGIGPFTFSWTGPNGFTSTSATPVISNVTAAAAGTYTVTVTDNHFSPGLANTNSVTVSLNPLPTLSGASQSAAVCAGSSATINLTGLLANSTSTVNYSIAGVAQTPVTGVVANASGVASFTTTALAAATNGQTLQITGLTVTSATPNCSATFTQNVTLTVNANPTLTGASQAASVCAGTGAVINLTGLRPSTTSTISYSINGSAQTPVTGVVANGSGAASFTSATLTAANNGQILQITGITITSSTPNCSASFAQNVTLAVNPNPTLSGASQATAICAGSSATINLTGLRPSTTSTISFTINSVAQTPVTGIISNASGVASFTTPVLTAANNGQILQVTGITITSSTPNCSASFAQNVTLAVNPNPTLSGASQAAAVCSGSSATINLTGLVANSTSTISYSINGSAQTPITGVVANGSGAASFTSTTLTAANNGQILQITGITITSSTPNCSASFAQNVTLAVNPNPTLSGASQASAVCSGSSATINLTGLVANSTSTISYSINGSAQTPVTGVVANGSGAASFSTVVLTTANNGQTLQVTGITITSATPNCSASFAQNVTLAVNASPTLTGATQAAAVCAGSSASINLTGLRPSTTSTISFTINSVAQTPVTGIISNASGVANFTTPVLTSANNGQILQVTGITITSSTPNCAASFAQNVTLAVNPNPTLSGATQAAAVCSGSGATINLTGLVANSTSTISYSINGSAQTPVTGVVANGSGAASFTTVALTTANNGQTLQVTGITITSSTPNCAASFAQNVTLAVNASPTLTGANQAAAVCAGSSATINLTGLRPSTTSTISFTINSVAQTPVTGIVSNASGVASFTTPVLTAANNGQILQITGITITSSTPNCSASFAQNVTLAVNPNPILSGASQASAVCSGSGATINLTGLVANSTSTISYSINGSAQTPVTGVVANGSGAASFTTVALTTVNNGQTLQVTGITITSTTPNCSASFAQNLTLAVGTQPIAPSITRSPNVASVCAGTILTVNIVAGSGGAGTVQDEYRFSTDNGANWSVWSVSVPSFAAIAGTNLIESRRTATGGGCNTSVSNQVSWTVTNTNTWVGGGNNFWSEGDHWSCGIKPVSAQTVIIGNGGNPILDENFTAGGSLTLAATSTLTINPNIVLSVSGTADFANQSVTIKSTAAGTGAIGTVSGTLSNATNVTVERYVPANRSWRLMSIPLTGTQTIKEAWANNRTISDPSQAATEPPAVGTLITGSGYTNPNPEYDYIGWALASSIRRYQVDGTGGSWPNSVANTPLRSTTLSQAAAERGYLLFVRGDRTVTTGTANTTTLYPKGSLRLGTQNFSVAGSATHKYEVFGNPYASSVNFESVMNNAGNSNAVNPDRLWIWNPYVAPFGGYNLVKRVAGSWFLVPSDFATNPGTANANAKYIQSGQAFILEPTASGGTLSIQESNKEVPAGTPPTVFGAGTLGQFYANLDYELSNGVIRLSDGVLAVFDNDFSKAVVDENDVVKPTNLNENFAIKRAGSNLAMEALPVISATDTIFFDLTGTSARAYALQFRSMQMQQGLTAFLEDKFLQKQQPINLADSVVTTYRFSITSDPLSAAPDRFYVIFKAGQVLPITLSNAKAYQLNSGIQVDWQLTNERDMRAYEVEKSLDGSKFIKQATISAANRSTTYSWTDAHPAMGANYYRIKVIATDGSISYSQVLLVKIGAKTDAGFSVYPNPVKGRSLGIQLINLEKGAYTMKLFNQQGQLISSRKLNHLGGSASEEIRIEKAMPAGMYRVGLSNSKGYIEYQTIIIQ